jgi:phosphatidylinositol 4-kinase B
MFELFASISIFADFSTIALYCIKPTIFGDDEDSRLLQLLNPLFSVLLLVVLAVLRVAVFVPYVWRYQKDDLLVLSQRPYLWHTFNVVLILFKAVAELARGGDSQNLFVWIAICCSLLSVYCQSLALKQLISTALPERHLVLGLSLPHSNDRTTSEEGTQRLDLKPASAAARSRPARRSCDRLLAGRVASYYTEAVCCSSSSDSSPHAAENNSEFLQRFREQLDVAHNEWNMKIVKLKESIANFGNDNDSFSRPDTVVFEELLLMFATNSNNPNFGKEAVMSAVYTGYKEVASDNVQDLKAPLNPNSEHTTSAMGSDINTKETMLRLFANYPKTLEFYIPQLIVYLLYGYAPTSAELREALLLICEQSTIFAHRMFYFIEAYCIAGAGINPEGVAVLQQLLRSIEQGALSVAELIAAGRGKGEAAGASSPDESAAPFGPSAPQQFIAGDDIEAPPPPASSSASSGAVKSSAGGGGAAAAAAAPCLYPLLLTCPLLPGSNAFTSTILFWEQLSALSRDLVPFAKQERRQELQKRIPDIKKRFLPSSCIYAPVGDIHHRIWSIATEECFAFNTKTRAPMFVCLEVVDYRCPRAAKRRAEKPRPESVRKSWVHGLRRVMTEVGESLSPSPLLDSSSAHHRLHAKDLATADEGEDDSDSDCEQQQQQQEGEGEEEGSDSFQRRDQASAAAADSKTGGASWRRPLHRSQSTGSVHQLAAAGQWSALSRRNTNAHLSSKGARRQQQQHTAGSGSSRTSEGGGQSAAAHSEGRGGADDQSDSSEFRQRASFSNDSLDPASCFSPALKLIGDQPLVVFKERWRDKERRLRAKSGVGNLLGYRLLPVIVKTNDDLRQEEIAAQLLFLMNQILIEGNVNCWLRPYGIMAMSPDSGLIEAIPDTVSMDVLRRSVPNYSTLRVFFEDFFGPEGSPAFVKARNNFVKSLAPYCIVCYLLNLKDRHNGNILLDRKGHVMHIDFGFIFGISPGGNIGFESAPFKLTAEFVELMDGPRSALFHQFRECCVKTFMELRKHHYRLALLLEMISVGNEHLPCFAGNPGRIIDEMRKRFVPHIHDQAAIGHVNVLINQSIDNWTTSCYDKYQKCFVGVF